MLDKNIVKMLKILSLNVGIGVVDIILFSPGLLGIEIVGGSALATAVGATSIFMSAVVFVYGNYKLLMDEKKEVQSIKTSEDYVDALMQNYDKKIFKKDINTILEQIELFKEKRKTINDILRQKFDVNEMSYSKFEGVIVDVENVLYLNIKGIINKLNSFDEKDYVRVTKMEKKFSEELIYAKMRIYNEYISSIKKAVEDNEQIILKLDKILLELSKLNSIEEIEKMNEMKELNDLIDKIKLYN